MKKNIFWVCVFAGVIAVCALVYLFAPKNGGDVVGIWQDGKLIYTIDLSCVAEEYKLTLEYDGRVNTVLVGPKTICMLHADCPDGLCVDRGAIEDGVTPIICLPNRVTIRYMNGESGVDAVAGGAA